MNLMHDLRVRAAGLLAVTAVVTVLAATGVLPRWSGLIHLVALPPLDLIADLRVLAAAAPGYPAFLGGLALSLAVRITVLAVLLGGVDRRRLGWAARYYLLVLPLALLAVAPILAAGALRYAGLFWTGVAIALLTAVFTASSAWRSARLRLGTVGAYLQLLAALGALADLTGPAGAVALVPVSALLTLTAARLLLADPAPVSAHCRSQETPRSRGWVRLGRRVLAGAGAALTLALVVVVVTGPAGPPRAPEPRQPRPGSLMLMSGVDSSSGDGAILEIDPHGLGYTCDQTYYFSYAGPGGGQPRGAALCPVRTGAPYSKNDTMRPTADLVAALEAQLADLPPPVVLITHSQGVWITWEAALRHRLPNVGTLVLVGPFANNPLRGEPRLAADVTRLISDWARSHGVSAFTPGSPLGREWLAHPTAIERTLARPPEGIRVLGVPSVFDTPLTPPLPRAENLCPIPVIHPNLPFAAEFQRSLTRFLDHRPQPPCPPWRHAVGHTFRPFTVPAGSSATGRGVGHTFPPALRNGQMG